MANDMQLDPIDWAILDILQRDASLPVHAIGEQVGLSTNPCWRRIRRMEDAGIIEKRVALLDAAKAIVPPVIEVHLSDPQTREDFRYRSFIGEAAFACFKGKGIASYLDAVDAAAAL